MEGIKNGLYRVYAEGEREAYKGNEKELILFESEDKSIALPVMLENESVWLNRNQMSTLFKRDIKTIGKHINNALKEELAGQDAVVAKFATTASDNKQYMVEHYNLDVIISVGYRVKSKRGVEFRRWANSVLKEYIIKGYAVNHNRMNQLNEEIQVMKRVENSLDSKQVLTVVEWISILFWKRRRQIYYILLRRTIVFLMEING